MQLGSYAPFYSPVALQRPVLVSWVNVVLKVLLTALLVGMLDGRAPAEHHMTIPTIYGDLNSQSI